MLPCQGPQGVPPTVSTKQGELFLVILSGAVAWIVGTVISKRQKVKLQRSGSRDKKIAIASR